MKVTHRPFGVTKDGQSVTEFRLTNRQGAYVELLDYGCTVRSLVLPDAVGKMTDIVLGYDTLREYEERDGCLGAVVGRFANRIGGGKLVIDGQEYLLAVNDGPNHLHGGLRGFDRRVWKADWNEKGITFSRFSPDGEEGYPGNLQIAVRYEWSDNNELTIHYTAETDAATAVNLTNHSYFNLNGSGSVLEHLLQINADQITENDPDCLPTGRFIELADCPAMDFRTTKPVGRDIKIPDQNLRNGKGYDHNYVLRSPGIDREAARLYSPASGITLVCRTTQPGVQLYSANFLTERCGKNGAIYYPRGGVCLETQHFPDAIAKGFVPSPILRPGERLEETTVYAFSSEEP